LAGSYWKYHNSELKTIAIKQTAEILTTSFLIIKEDYRGASLFLIKFQQNTE